MRNIAGNLFLDAADMHRAGIGYDTLKKARTRGTKGYNVIDDPEDRRRILVEYATLKPQVKQVVDAVFGNAIKDQGQSDIKALLEPSSIDIQTIQEHVLPDGTTIPQDVQYKYVRACAYIRLLIATGRAAQKHLGFATAPDWYLAVIACITAEDIDLPRTYATMRRKLREFTQHGAVAVVSGKWGNSNRRIIQGPIEDFLISSYALPTKPDVEKVMTKYAEAAKVNGWPALSREAVWTHLHRRPEVKRRWYLGRHGESEWSLLFAHHTKRSGPTFKDALWCSDGSKLNIFYQTGAKVPLAAKMKVYIIMDVYSEAILGWSLGWTERFDMQQAAFRMALQTAQARPMQLLYDGQGGHKRKEAQEFFDRATQLHFPSKPRNPQAKPIESLIGRFQREVMKEDWAFTGQNVKSKKLDSRPNMEFILANVDKLPNAEELPKRVQRQVDEWNARHCPHTTQPRMQRYDKSVNPQAIPLELLDMVNLFWYTTARPIQYRKEGITLQVGERRHAFEVYTADGAIDEAFRTRHVGAKFTVKYDLEDFSYVMLYTEHSDGLRFVAAAHAKQVVGMAVVDLKPGDRAIIDHSLALREREIAETWTALAEHTDRSGIDRDTLIECAAHITIDKDELAHAEATLAQGIPDEDDDDQPFNPYANI